MLGFNASLLAGATSWTVERAVDEIHRAGGLAIAAHVDRERFGIVGQLGFVPPGPRARRGRGVGGDGLRRRPAALRGPARAAGRHRLRRARARRDRPRAHVPASRPRGGGRGRAARSGPRAAGRCSAEGGRWKTWRCTSSTSRTTASRPARRASRSGSTKTRPPTRCASSSRTTAAAWMPRRPAARPTRSSRPAGRAWSGWACRCCARPPRRPAAALTVASAAWRGHARGGRVRARPPRSRAARRRGNHRPGAAGVAPGRRSRLDAPARRPHEYSLATADLRAALDGASLASPAGLALLRSAVRHGEQSLADTAGSRSRTEDQP